MNFLIIELILCFNYFTIIIVKWKKKFFEKIIIKYMRYTQFYFAFNTNWMPSHKLRVLQSSVYVCYGLFQRYVTIRRIHREQHKRIDLRKKERQIKMARKIQRYKGAVCLPPPRKLTFARAKGRLPQRPHFFLPYDTSKNLYKFSFDDRRVPQFSRTW